MDVSSIASIDKNTVRALIKKEETKKLAYSIYNDAFDCVLGRFATLGMIDYENNKVVTFIKVENFSSDIKIPGSEDLLSGRKFSQLMHCPGGYGMGIGQAGPAKLYGYHARDKPFHWGELVFFFEMATAFEGELANLNAFDQPGVEGYKNYMYYKLGKQAWQQVESAATPEVKMQSYDDNLDWTMLDRNFDGRIHRTRSRRSSLRHRWSWRTRSPGRSA
jgi:hypothetical protein